MKERKKEKLEERKKERKNFKIMQVKFSKKKVIHITMKSKLPFSLEGMVWV